MKSLLSHKQVLSGQLPNNLLDNCASSDCTIDLSHKQVLYNQLRRDS
jgi:hypothetical protein